MSATSNEPDETHRLDDPPEFDLHCRFDDPENPTEVTVFPSDMGKPMTERWLSIEKGYALPIEEIR